MLASRSAEVFVDQRSLDPFKSRTNRASSRTCLLHDCVQMLLILCDGLAHRPSNVVIDKSDRPAVLVDPLLLVLCMEVLRYGYRSCQRVVN